MEHDKQRPYTPEEIRTINQGIFASMTEFSEIGDKIKTKPIRCEICYKEVLILPINAKTPRDPQTGLPVYPTKIVRSSSLDKCPRCHSGRKEDPKEIEMAEEKRKKDMLSQIRDGQIEE